MTGRKQSYRNHRSYRPFYHGVILLTNLALVTGASINLAKSSGDGQRVYGASLIFVITIVMLFMFFYTRLFALRAQDRAIRAEQNLRHFVLTGKLLDPRLGIRQIVALRFASDEEFLSLAQKAADSSLTPDEIKKEIRNWLGDYHRV